MSTERRIAVLPSAVADQIAAGEVVERPASVVKELVENALDAGATALDIAIGEGGRALIRIADDGQGMSSDDAWLAVERHATSKIRSAQDLVGVTSFGFRGEALPSIGSVSRMEIETATADGAATRVRVVGGTRERLPAGARRRGTTVTVEALFFNTPARLKFMKGARSEWRAISDALTSLALVRRDVRLHVTHDGKEVLAIPPGATLRDRVSALWGAERAQALVAVDDVSGPIRVAGLVERPDEVGLASRRVFLAVNGRAVRDAGMVRAAEAAYRSTIPAGLRPTLLLDITMPAQDVDVNVHPAKAEVRFRDRWTTERAVERAVRHALGTGDGVTARFTSFVAGPGAAPSAVPVDIEVLRPAARAVEPLFAASADAAPGALAARGESPKLQGDAHADERPADAAADSVIQVPPLKQLRRTWLAFEDDTGLVLIDQHSAHERVLYERFMHALARGDHGAQALLFPLTLHLSPDEWNAFEASADVLRALGFDAQPFGGNSIAVHAVPAPHPRFDAERCLRDTLAQLAGDRATSTLARHERLAATVACKAAIKAGDLLSADEMRALFVQLARTTLPVYDVHGRSAIVRLGWDELERRFGRT
ncbi:MAG: DNA mismatch repair endonuclease MutL [Gemmatimonadetes bacterium]|nr:DNA mismatch repair endonuclease MutL [Gemmatimonadota bacterium]